MYQHRTSEGLVKRIDVSSQESVPLSSDVDDLDGGVERAAADGQADSRRACDLLLFAFRWCEWLNYDG